MLQAEAKATCLLPIALSITAILQAVDHEWLKQRIEFLSTVADPSTVCNAFTYANRPDLFMTSWRHLFANWTRNIPGTSGDGKASAVRRPGYLSEGGARVLPRKNNRDGDYELFVCLEDGEMARLIEGLGDLVGRVIDA